MYGLCVSCLPSSVGLCRLCLLVSYVCLLARVDKSHACVCCEVDVRRMCLHGAYTLLEPLVITCVYALIAWAAIDCQCTIVEPLCQAGQHRTLPRRSARYLHSLSI